MAGKVDAQFAIDVAARMSGGEQTTAELDALTARMMGAGRGADFFQQAIKKLSDDLSAASAASESANSALAAGQAEYRALETAALQAAKAAEKAAAKSGDNSDEFLDLAMKALDAESAVNDYASTLRKLEKEAAAATKGEEALGQQLANVKKLSGHVDRSLAAQAERLEKFGGALGAVGGPLGQLGQNVIQPLQGFSKLSATIGSARAAALLGVVGVVALTAAITALGIAAAVATVKVAAWAVGLADAKRSADLMQEATEALHPELSALKGDFEDLKKETGLSQSDLNSVAKQLLDAGESADSMSRSLHVAALAQRALGTEGSAEYIKLVKAAADATKAAELMAEKTGSVSAEAAKNVADTTAAVEEFAHTAQSKLGGIVARQMLSVEAQSERAKKGFEAMFSGLNIDPALEGMKILVDLLDENSEAAKTVKFLFEEIFQPIIDQAKEAAIVVEAFYLGFLIGATKIAIAVKPVFHAISELFGFDDKSFTELLSTATKAGEIFAFVMTGLVVAFGLIVGAIVGAAAAIGGFITAIVAIPVIVAKATEAIGLFLVEAFKSARDFIMSIDFVGIGTSIMQGLANGIMAGGAAVLGAITSAVRGAINAAKGLLGIASPSKVFAELGEFTGEGFTMGIESENDNAHEALATMADPNAALAATSSPLAATPSPTDNGSTGGGEAAASGGQVFDFTNATLVFQGVKDAPSGIAQFREMLVTVIKGEALAVGGKA